MVQFRPETQDTSDRHTGERGKPVRFYPIEYLINAFLTFKQGEGRSPKTISNSRSILIRFMNWLQGKRVQDLSLLTRWMYGQYLVDREKQAGGQSPWLQVEHITIRDFVNFCAEEKLIPADPLQNFKRKGPEEKPPRALPWDVVQQHIEKIHNRYQSVQMRDKMIVKVLANVGLRPNEALDLKREDVDTKNRALWVDHTKNKKAGNIYYPQAIHDDIMQWLQMATLFWPNSEWLFPERGGGHMKLRNLQAAFRGYGIKSPYWYRGSCFTRKMQLGVDVRKVQAHARHSNIRSTARYLAIFDPDRKDIADVI
jgi:integrase